MLVAPKYEGLDLPVHEPETFVATKQDMTSLLKFKEEVVKNYSVPTFVRAIMIELRDLSHAPSSAAELLEKTERELEAVAERCGILVVGHEWGLYPVHDRDYDYKAYLPSACDIGDSINLPEEHILVAEVDVVKPDSSTESESSRRISAAKYYEGSEGTYQLYDLHGQAQFVFGGTVKSPDSLAKAHLVDIEPRFRLTR